MLTQSPEPEAPDNQRLLIMIRLDNNPDRIGIYKGKNRSTQRKTSRSRVVNQQQTQPTYDAGSGNRTRDTLVGCERSHYCANPAPQKETFTGLYTSTEWNLFTPRKYISASSSFWPVDASEFVSHHFCCKIISILRVLPRSTLTMYSVKKSKNNPNDKPFQFPVPKKDILILLNLVFASSTLLSQDHIPQGHDSEHTQCGLKLTLQRSLEPFS